MIYIVLVISFLLRLISINQSLWLDEATSAIVVRDLSFSNIITQFSPNDFHPPLYYLLLKLWSDMVGYSEIALRIPSVVFGVATVYITYLIGNKLFNKKTGLIASLLLATSGLHIYYSQEARMYSLTAMFVSLSVYYYLRTLEANKLVNWILFSILITISFLSDYLAILIFPVFWIWGFMQRNDVDWWKSFISSHVLFIAISLFWLPIFLKQLNLGIGVQSTLPIWWNILGQTNVKNILLIPIKFILGRISIDNNIVYGVVSGFICALFFWLTLKARKSKFLWIWLVIPLASMAIIGFFIPVVYYFRVIFLLPALYLLIANGITNIKHKFTLILSVVLVINLVTSFVYLFNQKFQREDWRGIVKLIEEKRSSDDIVIFTGSSGTEAYRYYAPDAKIAGPKSLDDQYRQVWFMSYLSDVYDPNGVLLSRLRELDYEMVSEYSFRGVGSVSLYKNENRN